LHSIADATAVLDAVGHPAFVVAADHTIAGYNDGLTDLLDIDPEVHVGEDARERIAAAVYADQMVEHPREAAAAFDGLERVDDRSRFAGEYVYEDRSTMRTERGEESLISFVTTTTEASSRASKSSRNTTPGM
jgi:hypothetical protein